MSYSNGRLPEDTHGKVLEIIKGLPGFGFKLTGDGDYDIENKKLRNVAEPQSNSDASTKRYVDQINNNITNKFSDYLKKDGTDKMTGLLDMNNSRIENVGPGRHGTADALTHVQFEVFYFDLNTDSGNIEAQNPIDMKNEKIVNLASPSANSDAATKKFVDDSIKSVNKKFPSYLKRDGTLSVTGDLNFGDNIITQVGNGSQSTDIVNKGYIDTELAAKPNVNQVILRDGSQYMTGDLNMSQQKIVNCGPPSSSLDVPRKRYVDNKFSRCLRLDGSNTMTGNLDMNNLQISNVKNASHNQDVVTLKQVNDGIATITTRNNEYTDKKIAESHISAHENRKNVLIYAMDDAEFTTDIGIQDANLITYNDSPHQTNKKAFTTKVPKIK